MRLFPLAVLSVALLRPMPALASDAEVQQSPGIPAPGVPAATPADSAGPQALPSPADTLDRARIQAEYGDGDFEVVIEALEGFRATHKAYSASDSLFIAKYLGVIYSSNPASREKGKYWLYRMLQIDPAADLVDMYVGEAVDRTFERVRQEFIVRRNYRGINDMQLARSVAGPERSRDTVVVRDTVKLGAGDDSLPERSLRDFRTGWTGNLNLGVGLNRMDGEDWGTTSLQKELRLAFDIRQRRWPINIAVDFMYSVSEDVYLFVDDSTVSYRQRAIEINGGVRKIFDGKLYSMRPFVGGGFGYMATGLEGYYEVGGGNLGAWAEGGVYWELERHFNIGAAALWSWTEISTEVGPATAGGMHFAMILGYHW